MRRALLLLKNAWLIVWNLALMALFWGVPLVAVYQGGWLAAVFIGLGAVALWMVRAPGALLGLVLGLCLGITR